MADPYTFARNIDVMAKNVKKNSELLVKRAAIVLHTTLVNTTPVDKGTARSNWQVGIDEEPQKIVDPAPVSDVLLKGRTEILKYDGNENRKIVVGNPVPYIEPLNNGWSSQAPAGFIESAILVAQDAITGQPLLTGRVKIE